MGASAYMRPRASRGRNESGAVLVTTLLTILLLTAMGNVVLNTSIIETMMSRNYRSAIDALYVAEAGLQHGIGVLNSPGGAVDGFDDEIGTTIASDTDFAGGSYTVTVADNDDGDSDTNVDSDNTIVLTAIGTVADGSRTIRAVVFRAPYTTPGAVVINGDLTMGGDATISGAGGSIHTNGNLIISGTPTVSQNVSASGTVSGNTGGVAGTVTSGAATQDIPLITPSDYQIYAEYSLQSDGKVKRMSDLTIVHDVNVDGPWNNWTHSVPNWTMSGASSIDDAMLYIEGNVTVSSNPASWSTALVATGSIELSGQPILTNYKDASDPVGIQNLLFVAGTDLKINGNASQTLAGVIGAGEQLQISGDPTLSGTIIIGNTGSASGLVTANDITGEASITYSGGLDVPFGGTTGKIRSWLEVTS